MEESLKSLKADLDAVRSVPPVILRPFQCRHRTPAPKAQTQCYHDTSAGVSAGFFHFFGAPRVRRDLLRRRGLHAQTA
jgi:hypothetical protein